MCVASAQVVCTERKEPLCILWLSAMRLQISSAVFAQRSNPRSRQTSRMCRWSYLMLFILPSFQTAHLASPEVWPKRSSLQSLRWTGLWIRSRHAWVIVEWCGMSSGAARYYDDHSWADIPSAGILQRVCNLKISTLVLSCCMLLPSWHILTSLDLGFTFVNIWRHLKQEGLSEPFNHSEPSWTISHPVRLVVVAIGEPSSLTSYMVLSTCVALWSPQIRKLQRQWSLIGTPIK